MTERITLVFNDEQIEPYPDDLDRMAAVCEAAGYDISRIDAQKVWKAFNRALRTGWFGLPDDDDDLLMTVLAYCKAR